MNGSLEGEEGDANNSYAGADKDSLALPDSQLRLMEAVCSTGKPVVLLLATGSAMELSYAEEHCSAIVQVWYPGQMGGKAAARLLFGDSVPSGKLPVTFYRTTEELPPFTDYGMKNKTYRYMEKEALYPFGYGLSYGKIHYDNMEIDSNELAAGGPLAVKARVRNTSEFPLYEVVQAYVKISGMQWTAPNFSLVDFKCITLEAGEEKAVEFSIPSDAFQLVNEDGERVSHGGEAILYVGGSQPDPRSIALTGMEPLSVNVY